MAVFGPKLQFLKLRSATCESRSRPPPLSFLLKLCVIVLHTHRYHPPKFHLNPKHHDGVLILAHFARAACCLLLACLLAACLWQPSGPRYGGLDVHLGNFEGWKPQKVGGCGWSRCPRNRILSHVAKDMAYSRFVAVGIWSFWGPFWAVSTTYHGVRGPQRAR